jgi:hypothetical protein
MALLAVPPHPSRSRHRTLCSLLALTAGLLGTPSPETAVGQYSNFNVYLRINTESAEKTADLYEGLSGRPAEIAQLRGSQIALATTSLLLQRPLDVAVLERSLEAAKYNQSQGEDFFRMQDARAHVAAIQELVTEIGKRNFGQKVVSTVGQLFPEGTAITTTIPVYFVAFGQQNIDAFVRRVVWHGNVPQFVGEGEGELTIVVNLANAVRYGRTVDERFIGLMSVVAHEVFHAVFGVYKDQSPRWQSYYAGHREYIDQLLDLTQNEGIAYYLSLVQRSRGVLGEDQVRYVQAAFEAFNKNAEALLSPGITPQRAGAIIRLANTSGYWESYGSMTGMIIARQIDRTMGREALIATVANGPADFFSKYADICRQDSNLPTITAGVLRRVGR